MGSTEEAFCLKWNDFQKSVTSSFAELRRDSDLTDVTIVVEGTQLKAHKVILSACSGAFKDLFRSSSHISKEPVVMLWDVTAEDMEALFNFMYQGQVNVVQERLNAFLALAERLRVKGLTNKSNDDEDESNGKSPASAGGNNAPSTGHSRSNTPNASGSCNNETRKRIIGSPMSSSNNKKQRPRNEDESDHDSGDKSMDKTHPIVMIKQESGKISTSGEDDGRNDHHQMNELDDSSYGGDFHNEYFEAEGEQFTEDLMQGTSQDYSAADSSKESRHENCSWCNRSFRNLNQHIDDIHLATPTPCPLCGKVFSSKPKMLKHKTLKHHGEIRSSSVTAGSSPSMASQPTSCPYCGKFFDTRQGMNGHTAHCSLRPKSNTVLTAASNPETAVSLAVCPDCGRLFQSKHQMYGHRAHCKARIPPPPKKPLPTLPTLPTHPLLPSQDPYKEDEAFDLLDKGNMIWVE